MKYALTETAIRNAKPKAKPYKLADGGGLYINVSVTGTKSWRFDYRFDGRYKTLTIGTFPAKTQRDARTDHQSAIDQIVAGIDPSEAKRAEKADDAARPTFRDVAASWLDLRNKKRAQDEALAAELARREGRVLRQKRTSKTGNRDVLNVGYLNADLGDRLIDELEVKHLAAVLDKLEAAGKYETRIRVQGTACEVLRFAHGKGIVKTNPFAGTPFARAYTPPANKPRPAVTEPEAFGHLLRKVDHFEGREGNITGIALKLLALTFVRPAELTGARWSEFDIDNAKWNVPPDALKMESKRTAKDSDRAGKAHEVPLSRQALALLEQLRKLTGDGEYLFPGRQGARSMSENTINNALQALGYKDTHCAHGFRSSASSILNDERVEVNGRRVLLWPEQGALIEVQLDHDDDSTRAIYRRGGQWEDRVELMQHWANLIDRLRSGTTAPGTKKKPHLVAVAA